MFLKAIVFGKELKNLAIKELFILSIMLYYFRGSTIF